MSNPKLLTQDSWTRRLEWALNAIPAKDRDEITREAHSHIEGRLEQGSAIADILASLGTPEEYAYGFFEEFELSEALGRRTTTGMLRVAVRRINHSATTALVIILIFCISILGVSFLLTSFMHFIDPLHWGVWYSTHMFLIGFVDDPKDARQLLGTSIYPIAMLCSYCCWNIVQIILVRVLRSMTIRKV